MVEVLYCVSKETNPFPPIEYSYLCRQDVPQKRLLRFRIYLVCYFLYTRLKIAVDVLLEIGTHLYTTKTTLETSPSCACTQALKSSPLNLTLKFSLFCSF